MQFAYSRLQFLNQRSQFSRNAIHLYKFAMFSQFGSCYFAQHLDLERDKLRI